MSPLPAMVQATLIASLLIIARVRKSKESNHQNNNDNNDLPDSMTLEMVEILNRKSEQLSAATERLRA